MTTDPGLLRPHAEQEFAAELEALVRTDDRPRPTSWRLSPWAVVTYLMGGTLKDGTAVGGRIHAVCVDKVLYCIQITYPLGYKDDYLNVFSEVRQTLKRAN